MEIFVADIKGQGVQQAKSEFSISTRHGGIKLIKLHMNMVQMIYLWQIVWHGDKQPLVGGFNPSEKY